MFYTNVQIRGANILHRGYDDEGKRFSYKEPCEPYLFVAPYNGPSDYKTLDGRSVKRIDFESPREAQSYIAANKDMANREVFGLPMFGYTFINDTYKDFVKYDADLVRGLNFDIEVAADEGFPDINAAEKEVTAITFKYKDRTVAFGCQPYKPKNKKVLYLHCDNEAMLLTKFVECFRAVDPDYLTGWNIEGFDIPYIINRIKKIVGDDLANKLSPFGILKERIVEMHGKENKLYDIVGVSTLDYMQLYKKFKLVMQESYSLNHIAHVELGEKKLDYSEHDSLFDLYLHDWEKFMDYNIQDVELVERLDDKLKYIEQALAIAYDAKVNYQDVFTSVRLWDVIIHNYLLDKNIVVPHLKIEDRTRGIEGGYVKDPHIGMHKWVVSFDLNSLYPHLIMQYNISPETWKGKIGVAPSVEDIIEGAWSEHKGMLVAQNLSVAATGDMYDRDFKGFLPELMYSMYNDRVVWKNKMIKYKQRLEVTTDPDERAILVKKISQAHNMQFAKKIQLNSAYGALANQYFRWYDLRFAESITKSGQLSIRWIEKTLNKWLNEKLGTDDKDFVIAIDTDSVYITLESYVEKFHDSDLPKMTIVGELDNICKDILEPIIEESYHELAEYANAMEDKMVMKRENIADKAIWTGKKHYCMNVWDSEGVRFKEPQLKIMGIEAVRSSTPASCRQNIKDAISVIMNKEQEDLLTFISTFKDAFKTMPFEDVAFPRGCNNLAKYHDSVLIFKKKCPIAVRGALVYNKMIIDYDLKRAQPVMEGEKIKFCYLKLPNPARQNVISSVNTLPRELGLDEYIDYETQFEKAFLKPIRSITDAIGWECERRATLGAFFDE
tara:strand:- start:726 stop:3236 length:2511 start_codon:yes stop_codon:yes gene_type:complete